jgi:hypothetical protein
MPSAGRERGSVRQNAGRPRSGTVTSYSAPGSGSWIRNSRTPIRRLEPRGAGAGFHAPSITCLDWPAVVRTRGVAGVNSPAGHEYQTRQPSPVSSGAPAVTHTPAMS